MFLIVIIGNVAYSQNPALQQLEENIISGNLQKAFAQLNNINFNSLSSEEKALFYFLKGKYYESNNIDNEAYDAFLSAKQLYKSVGNIDKAIDINLDIAYLLKAKKYNPQKYSKYVIEFYNHALKSNDSEKKARGFGYLALLKLDEEKYDESLKNYLNGLTLIEKTNNDGVKSAFYNNIANLYNEKLNKPDSGLYYLQLDLELIKEKGTLEDYYFNYINQAASYHHKKDYKRSNSFLNKADSLPIKHYTLESKRLLYEGFHKNYAALDDYKNAYDYLVLSNEFANKVKNEEQNIAISEIQTKYQTKKTEVENFQLKVKAKTRNTLLVALASLLIVSLIIGWLIIKNSRRKQKILQQEKLIEQQKLEKALKDYELNSIDLMLEGQEKERQRIANDLHDNLGSMLATLKLNFENLKLRKHELRDEETKLYDRTDELIEEAYQKVRRLAHAQNAGVLANEGLIPALQKLAEKISIPGKLTIEVIPFGFNERIENSLEIAIFRMVQELATNIIKHSQATEAIIHLTRHEDNINIIVEDNGIGFKNENISEADGMGISSIQKKCEQLGGTMTIDSTPGKGTTIIIDIPV